MTLISVCFLHRLYWCLSCSFWRLDFRSTSSCQSRWDSRMCTLSFDQLAKDLVPRHFETSPIYSLLKLSCQPLSAFTHCLGMLPSCSALEVFLIVFLFLFSLFFFNSRCRKTSTLSAELWCQQLPWQWVRSAWPTTSSASITTSRLSTPWQQRALTRTMSQSAREDQWPVISWTEVTRGSLCYSSSSSLRSSSWTSW